ncbi:MAG: hypothetical protein J5836_01145 [Clostridia bacterium]|nr:hypothetical protein [Clostridia bacterium]
MINKFKRGITVVAAVIAIAIFSIVAAAGVSLAIKSVRAERNNIINLEVSVHAENALACYRAVGDSENLSADFLTALRNTDDYAEEDEKIVLNKSDYKIVIEADTAHMTFQAKKGDKVLLEYTYGAVNNG